MQTLLNKIVNVSLPDLLKQYLNYQLLSPLTSQLLPQSVYFQELLVYFEDDIEEAANLGHVDVWLPHRTKAELFVMQPRHG